jgi:tetratricopeptide (TPR) repeat protein
MLGGSLLGQKKYAEAEPLLLSAYEGLKQREDHIAWGGKGNLKEALSRLVQLYEDTGRHDQAARWKAETIALYHKEADRYRKAAATGSVDVMNELAWFLSTCVDSSVRDGRSAVIFAEKAVAATGRKDENILDTLAAACAEAGDFRKAVSVQKEAIALLHDEKAKEDYASRLKLYEANTPYREP